MFTCDKFKISTSVAALSFLGLALMFVASCQNMLPSAPAGHDLLDGPMEGLTSGQQSQFLAGDIAFNDAVFTPETGLGPFFVATSCGSCHAGDGKGHPFTTLTRFGQVDSMGNTYMGNGGPQLQNRAIPGHNPEQIPEGIPNSKLTPPAVTGLGLLAALTDAQILENADPNDLDGDGISGVPNYVGSPDYFDPQWFHESSGGKYIGRFGKKAAAVDLLHQTVNAYREDIGITSEFVMHEPSIYNSTNPGPDNAPDPEVASSTVRNVVFYLRTLKPPVPRNQGDADVMTGRQHFVDIGCGGCHVPQFITPQSDIAALSNRTINPYTDLLLHDMGPTLDDGYTEGSATTSEWRTPALWGLGLSRNSQGGQYFLLHDGRAATIADAVLLHGGEAEQARIKYQQLNETQKLQLIEFLEGL